MAAAVLERVRLKASCCPTDPTKARAHHAAAVTDAASGAPTSAEGRNLVTTARPWGDGRRVLGDCLCGSSFLYKPAAPPAPEPR